MLLVLKKINATGNPGCTLFKSECTISAENTLRIGPRISYRSRRLSGSYDTELLVVGRYGETTLPTVLPEDCIGFMNIA